MAKPFQITLLLEGNGINVTTGTHLNCKGKSKVVPVLN
jgi:hypothetical protein